METVSLIYKFLVLSMMIDQMNLMIEKLDLPRAGVTHPRQLTEGDIYIRNPLSNIPEGYIRSDKYHFAGYGRLGLFRLNTNGVNDWPDWFSYQGVQKTNVSSELAYQLARNWMEAASVDVAALEAKYQVKVDQSYSHAGKRSLVSPNFHVRWGDSKAMNKDPGLSPVAEVGLDAARKYLVTLQLNDLTFYRGNILTVTNAWAIALLPDEPVLQMLTKPGIEYSNTFALLAINPDYEAMRRQQLEAEIDRLLRLLEIDDKVNLKTEEMDTAYVNPPAFGLGGAFRSQQISVRFNPKGELSHFTYLPHPYTNSLILAQSPSTISSNRVFEIAREKLTALGFDVSRMDREMMHKHERRMFRMNQKHEGLREIESSEFHFRWGKTPPGLGPPTVQIDVSGTLGRVVRLEVNDASYIHKHVAETNTTSQKKAD